MKKEKAVFDRAPQIEKLRLDIGVSTTSAQQSGVAMADIVLALLQRADELCGLAHETGVDISRVAGAFAELGEAA